MTTTDDTEEATGFVDFPRTEYAEVDGPLCSCGHYSPEHAPSLASGLDGAGACGGQVGNDTCTCLGFRVSRKARR